MQLNVVSAIVRPSCENNSTFSMRFEQIIFVVYMYDQRMIQFNFDAANKFVVCTDFALNFYCFEK